ncbi:MAG: metallo-beta-lactamase family protein [Crocinitomicaceae bacterium]|jgi:metallo-beta-lactamase family protein
MRNENDEFKIKFLGGAGTVTGSKTIVEYQGKKVLIDCGLFQGLKYLRKLNREPFPIDPSSIDCIILTHAHLDHCGYIPVLVKNGFKGVIYCTSPTKELTEIILRDSGKIQEEDAKRANAYNYSKHSDAKPLYTVEDAEKVSALFSEHAYGEWVFISPTIKFQLLNAGHIIGSAMVELKIGEKKILFSGDIGRKNPMLLYPPKKVDQVDYLVLESTYGDREHEVIDVKKALSEIILETYKRKGILMVPSFAVERTQEIIYLIFQLKKDGLIPNIPIYLDSPMATKATQVFDKYQQWQDVSKFDLDHMYESIHFIGDYKESKAVVLNDSPKIVIAGSGMLEGGRIIHYLNNHMSNPKNTLLFTGFQAAGTRGRAILEGSEFVKFFGEYHEVKCQIESISSMSAHADRIEMLNWIREFKELPKKIFLNHGEPHQADSFRVLIESKLDTEVIIPFIYESFDL